MENVAQDKPTPFTRNTIVQLYIRERERERERERDEYTHDHLKTPANMNGTTTSPWRAKIQRIGLLNMIYILTARAWLKNPEN